VIEMRKILASMAQGIKGILHDIRKEGFRKGISLWWFKRNYYWSPRYEWVPVIEPAPNDPFMLVKRRPMKRYRMPPMWSIKFHYYYSMFFSPNGM